MSSPLAGLKDDVVGGLEYSTPPKWLTGLDWVRRRLGYRLKSGASLAKKVMTYLPPTYDTQVVPGIFTRLDFQQDVARFTWWSGRHYEVPSPRVLVDWLADASMFFDIGANCGWYSYLALSASNAEVHAFEPIPSLIEQMEATKTLNGLSRFHPHQLGVGDTNGELRFHIVTSETSFSTFGPHPNLAGDPGVSVPVVAFDQWCADTGISLPERPTWVMKMDTEGFETKALRGMQKALDAQAFLGIAIEMNEFCLQFCDTSVAEVESILEAAGYVALPQRSTKHTLNAFYVPK